MDSMHDIKSEQSDRLSNVRVYRNFMNGWTANGELAVSTDVTVIEGGEQHRHKHILRTTKSLTSCMSASHMMNTRLSGLDFHQCA